MSSIIGGNAVDQNPVGMIVIWNASDKIPNNWQECNGSGITPDLRSKFLKSVPDAVTNPGSLGGVNDVTLTLVQLGGHNHNTVGSNHRHTFEATEFNSPASGARYQGAGDLPSTATPITELVNVIDSVQFEGGGGSHTNIPQFYDAIYIMKVKT